MGLKEYAAKRRFAETPEPSPTGRGEEDKLLFVIHKHAARALHYDLRLELDGVLKSWACPKGPSLDPAVKRLAVMVEDHPLAYKDFEGVIPQGNYGAGGVIIWDRGGYRHPDGKDRSESERLLREGLAKGDLKFILEGEKVKGEFALVKTGRDDKSWLLLKKRDRHAGMKDILAENRSVTSGLTVEELFKSGSMPPGDHRRLETIESWDLEDAPSADMPHRIRPMLATAVKEPFDHPDWIFEIKWDGYRAIAETSGGEVSLYSRNLTDLRQTFPEIVEALRGFRFEAVLDGEIVVVDDQGRPDFQLLKNRSRRSHLLYYVFDLLFLQGRDLTGLPLFRRKELLGRLIPTTGPVRLCEHVKSDGSLFYRVVREKGLEGIIAKHGKSSYLPATRSREWLKIKTQRTQEGVIAGFTAPRGGRKHFGTLVLGAFEGESLVFIGHSGGGFSREELERIHELLRPLIQQSCPFSILPPTNAPATWVKPELVCEVSFSGWTDEAVMRHPVFLRMREDKATSDVVRECTSEGVTP